jgi:MtN3 and saliva related transmembrane protein
MEYDAIIGVGAATLTTLSNWPQLKKCWQTGKAEDLSLRAFVILAVGVALWLVYGALKSDWIIMAANAVSLALLCGILFFKIREATKRSERARFLERVEKAVSKR